MAVGFSLVLKREHGRVLYLWIAGVWVFWKESNVHACLSLPCPVPGSHTLPASPREGLAMHFITPAENSMCLYFVLIVLGTAG